MSEDPLRLVVADDQRVVREGLSCSSASSTAFEVVVTAVDVLDAAEQARPR